MRARERRKNVVFSLHSRQKRYFRHDGVKKTLRVASTKKDCIVYRKRILEWNANGRLWCGRMEECSRGHVFDVEKGEENTCSSHAPKGDEDILDEIKGLDRVRSEKISSLVGAFLACGEERRRAQK